MALFEEEKVEQNGIYNEKDLSDLTPKVGDSIGFYFVDTDKRVSDEYGEFIIALGLQVNLQANSMEELAETAYPINFIPRTVLENKFHDGAFNTGELYRLEKTVNRGDTIKGKKVRYYAWDLYKVNMGNSERGILQKKLLELQGKDSVAGSETPAVKKDPTVSTAKKPAV